MTETTRACVRGCSLYQRHLTECEDPDACRGCLPRRAEHGNLCQPCHRRFELMLTDAPTVYRWLTGNMTAGEGASRMKHDYERRGKGKGRHEGDDWQRGDVDVPTPLKVDILDVRDLLADRLATWVDDWVEHKGLMGPDVHNVDTDAEYLLRWLPGLEALDWIGDWWGELAETMSEAHALAPWRPAMRRIPAVPCPGCQETHLVIFGGESDITCLSCKIIMTEDRFALWERVLKADQDDIKGAVG